MKKTCVLSGIAVLLLLAAGCSTPMESETGQALDFFPTYTISRFGNSGAGAAIVKSDANVCLKSATGFVSHYVPFFYVRATVLVKNLAYAKKVGIRYTSDGWQTWKDVDGDYCGSEKGLDRFRVQSYAVVAPEIEFAVYYTVNGQTYWDNNKGLNYRVSQDDMCIYPAPVQLLDAQLIQKNGGYCAEGRIAVQNLAYDKQVGVVFSVDHGTSWNTLSATYTAQFSKQGWEVWTFSQPLGQVSGGDVFRFAVRYDVNGETWWDNLHFYDYSLGVGTYSYVNVNF